MNNDFEKQQYDLLKIIYDYVRAHSGKDIYQEEIAKTSGIDAEELEDRLKILTSDRYIRRYWTSNSATQIEMLPKGKRHVMQGYKPEETTPQVSIGSVGTYIVKMQGGNVQGIGQAVHSHVSQFANDPDALRKEFDQLADQMLEIVRGELSNPDSERYAQLVDTLRAEMLKENGEPSIVKRLLNGLALSADIEGSLTLIARLMPYILVLWNIAATKFG
jgi:hypothetical protein